LELLALVERSLDAAAQLKGRVVRDWLCVKGMAGPLLWST
jgi:hypothetical protein